MQRACRNPTCYMHSMVNTDITKCLACGERLHTQDDVFNEFFRDDSIPVDADLNKLFGRSNLWRGKR